MSETANIEATSAEAEKPVHDSDDVKFPPFPDPKNEDFDEDISEEERNYYKDKYPDINLIKTARLHCTACDRHLGCSARNEARMRSHPMLRTLMCHTCHSFYNSGEFDKGEDGSELYCRWCGQGGQVYCCSDCPHVFCAKCVKRNLGVSKIKEIENTDDWKCFKCNPKCLWDLRAVCWAILRFCDLTNKIAYSTQDPTLKDAYQKDCANDHSTCCRSKQRKRAEKVDTKKKESDSAKKAAVTAAVSKIPPTIQVKKFASINLDESTKDTTPKEKKAVKRPVSPKNKIFIKNPIAISSTTRMINPACFPSGPKKIRMPNTPLINPLRIPQKDRSGINSYTRVRPKPPNVPPITVLNNQFNGFNNPGMFNNMVINDNINLSLESLTQGLDMAAVTMGHNPLCDSDVVCTPDFPLEPLCEVTEETPDDDVQCITPGPVATPKINTPPPLVTRFNSDLSSENIVQMTENDVTVNAATGGLKFRVDPQTLSSNKMYRLPDGRIFAINPNPNMPGGYSATIVAVTESNTGKVTPKGVTYAAKLSAVTTTPMQASTSKGNRSQNSRGSNSKRNTPKATKPTKVSESSTPRDCDLNVPIEWYRYNLIDAVDALEYSLSRLHKLKKETSSMYLRTRTPAEMRSLHRTLERLLNTSSTRFHEIRDNLNKELKQYLLKKMGVSSNNVSDDDDDVEILNDLNDDDPIFIDENSLDSNVNETNGNDTQEVDLTGVGSSEHNDSGEKSNDLLDSFAKDSLANVDKSMDSHVNEDNNNKHQKEKDVKPNEDNSDQTIENNDSPDVNMETDDIDSNLGLEGDKTSSTEEPANKEKITATDKIQDSEVSESKDISEMVEDKLGSGSKERDVDESKDKTQDIDTIINNDDKAQDDDMTDDKTQGVEMSDEMIETLLKDDCGGDDVDSSLNGLDI